MQVDSQYYTRQVWIGLLDAERLSRYYGRLAVRLQRWHFGLTVFIALCSTGAAATLIASLPGLIPTLLSLTVAAAAIWSSYANYSKKAAVASVIRSQCDDLIIDWKHLWSNLNADRQDIPQQVDALQRKLNEITKPALEHGLTDNALNEQCTQEAYESVQAEFAS